METDFNYISWVWVVGPRSMSLFDHICVAEKKLNISDNYCILANEKEHIQYILNQFQQDITANFFACNLTLCKPRCKIKPKDMFFYLLFTYLKEHECDYSFAGNIVYNQISKKSYGFWGGELYDSESELTDFGIAFKKLHYITSEYCYKHDEIRRTFNTSQCMYLRTQIDEKQISISRM